MLPLGSYSISIRSSSGSTSADSSSIIETALMYDHYSAWYLPTGMEDHYSAWYLPTGVEDPVDFMQSGIYNIKEPSQCLPKHSLQAHNGGPGKCIFGRK